MKESEMRARPAAPAESAVRAERFETVPIRLPTALTKRLRNLSRHHQVSLGTTLLSGWALLLARWSGQERLLIETGASGDGGTLRFETAQDMTVAQLLEHAESRTAGACSTDSMWFRACLAGTGTEQLELTLRIREVDGFLKGAIEYVADQWQRQAIERMARCWRELLHGMAKHLRRPIGQLGWLPAAEREQVLYGNNDTDAAYPHESFVHGIVSAQARRTPDAVAVMHDSQAVTYAELERRAEQLARLIQARGVGAGQLVAIGLERSVEMIVSVLATLKSGAAYVPLDPNYPPERLAQMVEDAAPALVLTQSSVRARLPSELVDVLLLDAPPTAPDRFDASSAGQKVDVTSDSSRVYVIFTSGSTGRPKGTEMSHRAMVNLIEWHRQTFDAQQGTRVLQFAALSFDVAFQELFTTLATGGTLVLLDEWVRRDSRALLELLSAKAIQRWFVPPLVLQGVAEHARNSASTAASLRDIITAGEQLRVTPEIVEFFTRLKFCRLHNHYGPTETHVVTALTLSPDAVSSWPLLPSIGRPIANTRIYLLDRQMQPVPTGVVGEIYIAGANVALGYLNRPELTAQRFVLEPFGSDPQARMYKTGDLGRWQSDGSIEYLGRNDEQFKIRGFRIEPGEIEAQLATHASVKEAAVVAREMAPGAKSLVAYITLRANADPSVAELRAYLGARLPEHMVPSAFVMLDALPVTPSGKLDRRSLPEPQASAYATREYEAPRDEAEQTLASVWQSLLGIHTVSRQDNFFALGGDSLSMARMIETLRQSGWSVDARTAFQSESLAALAGHLVRSAPIGLSGGSKRPLVDLMPEHMAAIAQSVPGGAENLQDVYPLAPLQEGLLFQHLLGNGQADAYVIPTLLSVASRVRVDELVAALDAVIERHDALRTALRWENLPLPVQVVVRHAQLHVDTVDLDPSADALEQVQAWLEPDRQLLDMTCAPLMRLRIAEDSRRQCWYVLLQLHHIIGDNTSQEILSAEIEAHLRDEISLLPEPVSYRHHVAYALERARDSDAESFFKAKLHDVEEPTAPFGLLAVRGGSGVVAEAHRTLDDELASEIRVQARRMNTSPAALFHAAWAMVAARTTGRDDVVFGTVLLGRLQAEAVAERMLGMFINTLPLRLRLQEVTAQALVQQTHRELSELLSYEQASLSQAQRCSGIVGSGELFTSLLNYRHHTPRAGMDWIRADGIRVLARSERTNYPLTLSIDDLGKAFALTAQTDARIGATRLIEYAVTSLRSLVAAIAAAATTPVLGLAILPEPERRQILESFNATQRTYPRGAAVHELFEEQAWQRPDAVAVVCDEQRLTYAELNVRANRLAHYLIAAGMAPGEYVPIIEERSVALIVAQLAVLKAGGAYVPMDPKLPAQRQAFMIGDCGARRVLVGGVSAAGSDSGMSRIEVQAIEPELAKLSTANPNVSLSLPAAAYVMYTSGSTGTPKGVIVAHHGINRLIINCAYADLSARDCIAHCSNPMFDAATFEVWAALLHGGKLVVVPQSVVLDPARLSARLLQERVTVLWMTIGLFTQYADLLGEVFSRLRYLITGGDVVDPEVARRVLSKSPPEHFLNAYGPTESTTFTTTYEVPRDGASAAALPIGGPVANTTVYILDRFLQPVPIGAVGELYIGGDGVALGYLNRADLTAQRFIPDRFSTRPGARLYKSGDLARWRTDGDIEFLGRADQQIKLRGYRIELGEIEASLLKHPRVKEAVVVVREDATANKCLVAYIVVRDSNELNTAALREYLSAALPEHMVPSATVVLDRLPLNASGKLDRRALPTPTAEAYSSRAHEPPRGDTEEVIATVWRELLQLDRVGRNDTFFELGGHSLLAMQVMVRIRSMLGIELSMNTLFEFPSLRELAAQVEQLRDARLLAEVASGGEDVEALLEQIAMMPEGKVHELMQKIQSGGRQ